MRWRLQCYDELAIRIFCNYPNFSTAVSVAPFVPVDDPKEADVLFSPQPINAFMKVPEWVPSPLRVSALFGHVSWWPCRSQRNGLQACQL